MEEGNKNSNNQVTFYFVRHGETYLNKYVRMQGWSNAPLTVEGEKGCIASGKGLSHIKFDHIYTSDLQRTKDTAKLILSQNKVTTQKRMIERYEFREVFFGQFEALPAEEVWEEAAQYAEKKGFDSSILNRMNALHEMDTFHDAESYSQFWQRIEKGLLFLLTKYKNSNKNILVVSHGLTINLLLHAMVASYIPQPLENASVSKVIYKNGQFHLEYVNQTNHFIYE